jgi:hypothetical protein
MVDKKQDAQDAQPQTVRSTRADANEPTRHDQTRPGGYYIGADGEPHDANGDPIKDKSKD